MSRLIVKNLAKSVTVDKLREVFSEKGFVTDVQLKYTADGKFRHFGFVGFKNEEDALQALEYFNNTFINSTRVKVELCSHLGDPNKPWAWSKYAPDSNAYKKIHGQEDRKVQEVQKEKKGKKGDSFVNDILKKYENDSVFTEFIEARSKGNLIWSNDNVADDTLKEKENNKKNISKRKKSKGSEFDDDSSGDDQMESKDEEENDEDESSKIAKADISDMEYLKMKVKGEIDSKKLSASETKLVAEKKRKVNSLKEELFTVKVKGIKFNSKKRDIKQFFHPLKPKSIRLPVKIKGIAYVGFASEKEMKVALKKNSSFLEGRRIFVVQYGGDLKNSVKVKNINNKWEEQVESIKNEESIAESGRIFVRNLAYSVTENDIELLFSKYGGLTEVIMPIDRISRKPKGFAVITFLMPEHAVKAYMELDGSVFHGRMLHLIPGKYKKTIEEMLEMEGLTYKQKKALKLKAQAAASNNWNTLFLGQNAVADLIAKTYGTSKEQVLDVRGKENLAVRLALGETQIVNETKQFLEDNGVHLDAFNEPATQRSKTVILVKNLPAETKKMEILQLFAKFGELGRVLLPPSGVTAIVEFLEPSEARAAFRKLAYSKFKHVPLYLEWAPSNAFSTPFSGKKTPMIIETSNPVNDTKEDSATTGEKQTLDEKDNSSEEEEYEPPEPDTTLFIKNLNFKTTEDDIREHFKKCGPIHDVTVTRKKDTINPGKLLSCGYGFIQFKRKSSLEKALKSYQSSVLDEHSLELKRSNRTLQTDVVTARNVTKIGKQMGSKLLVRNVPFQATHRELRELFKTFGEIKALRLPQKMAGTGSHRGFAFVEYYTKHDAKRALKALSQSTHLYGRRLVLDWARSDDNVGELQRKTASQFMETSSNYQRSKGRANFDIEMETPEIDQQIL